MVEVRISETERRQHHISRIDSSHTLLPIALNCLKDRDVERPSAQELCERVLALKESLHYRESVRAAQEGEKPEQVGINERDRELRSQRQQHSQQVHNLQQIIQSQLSHLEEKDRSIMQKDQAMRRKDETIAELIRQQLDEIGQLEKEKNQVIEEKERQLEESKQTIAQFQRRIVELEHPRPATDTAPRSKQQSSRASIKLTWKEEEKAPCKMISLYSAAVDSIALYVRLANNKVYTYTVSTSTWSQLPDSPTTACPSVIINKLLTLIGGRGGATITNQLFSLTGEGSSRRWTEEFPPMPTKRHGTIALCTETALIVAGGCKLAAPLKTVEVMNIETHQWSTASDLPQPLWNTSATICGDHIYIISLGDMYTCSVSTLIQSCRSGLTASLWNRVAAPSVSHTTVSIHGQLLAIGGPRVYGNKPTTAIHMYSPTTNSWEVISHMATPRCDCIAAVFPNNQLMVVGGRTGRGETDSVEFANIQMV